MEVMLTSSAAAFFFCQLSVLMKYQISPFFKFYQKHFECAYARQLFEFLYLLPEVHC